MRTTTSQFDDKAEAAQNKPVEIVDIFLGSQVADDADTLHFALYDANVSFFDIDGNAQSYTHLPIKRSRVTHNMEMRRDSVTLQIDNMNDAFQTLFWNNTRNLQDRRVLIRQLFANLVSAATHAVTIMDGIIDSVRMTDKDRICQVTVVSFMGFIAFKTGVPLDRICPIATFADSRCAQGVTASTLTQETTDNVDAGSTTTAIKVKTLAQADDYWNIGKIEFTSGANDGRVRKIIDWVQSTKTFTLDAPLPSAPAEDDTVNVKRDCNRTLDMCRTRFTEVGANGNMANFRGFNTVPTTVNP